MRPRPTLADFGLTEERVAQYRRRVARLWRAVYVICGAGGVAAATFFLSTVHPTRVIDWIGDGVGALFIGSMGLVLTGAFGAMVWAIISAAFDAATARLPLVQHQLAKFEKAVKEYDAEVLRGRREFWLTLKGHEFEHELGELYRRVGYGVTVTKGSGDEGIDVLLVRAGVTTVVQCKAHAVPVGPAVVRELWGAMHAYGAQRCMLASLGGFTPGVRRFAKGKAIELVDLDGVLAFQSQVQTADGAGHKVVAPGAAAP